uniref:26S proteasome complex subunit SEM1 n=1 Tax=Monopterus albus TaxID=43700 RepID=A0A3Q3R9N2_MONAL
MSEKKQTVDLGLLEEDDEFEEFPAEDWTGLDEDEDAHVWEDNWDDDNVEDDFSNQLSEVGESVSENNRTCDGFVCAESIRLAHCEGLSGPSVCKLIQIARLFGVSALVL